LGWGGGGGGGGGAVVFFFGGGGGFLGFLGVGVGCLWWGGEGGMLLRDGEGPERRFREEKG